MGRGLGPFVRAAADLGCGYAEQDWRKWTLNVQQSKKIAIEGMCVAGSEEMWTQINMQLWIRVDLVV